MWLPLTSRTPCEEFKPVTCCRTSATHGPAACPARLRRPGSRQDERTEACRIDQIQDHEPRIVDPAVRIFKSATKLRPQRSAFGCARQVEVTVGRQSLPAAQMIVEKQSGPHAPGGPLPRRMRQNESQRPNDVWRRRKQDLPLDQRFAHQTEFVIFEIAQPAVNQLARTRRGSFGEITLFAKQNLETAASGVARDTGSIDAAADDGDVDQ